MQNILWWECEEYSDSWFWQNEKLGERLKSMIERLLRHIKAGELQMYFEIDVNLLNVNPIKQENLKLELKRIVAFNENPMSFLKKVIHV